MLKWLDTLYLKSILSGTSLIRQHPDTCFHQYPSHTYLSQLTPVDPDQPIVVLPFESLCNLVSLAWKWIPTRRTGCLRKSV